jgi:twinkle protein
MADSLTSSKTFADFGIEIPYGRSGEVRAVCPQCAHTRKPAHQRERDLAVNTDTGQFVCHHCGWKGGLSTSESPVYGERLRTYEKPRPLAMPQTNVVDAMYGWFERERGISRAVVERNRITPVLTDRGWAMAFPHFRNGEHIGTQYRTKDKQIWQEKGAERIFYGLDDITADTTEVIICEGQIDKLAFEMAGKLNCLSVPDGAPNAGATTTTKISYLEATSDLYPTMERLYIAADNDANGQALNQALARRIGREKCWIVEWRDGIKDANDALRMIGAPEILESLELAKPFPIEGIVRGGELHDELLAIHDRGYDHGLTTGLPLLDQHYRVRAGLMSIVTGYASHGKSLWLDQILVRLARRHGWRFAIFSPENMPVSRHIGNLIEIHVGKPFDRGFTARMTQAEVEDALPFISDHFTWVYPESPSLDTILDLTRKVLIQTGINGLVIDPWNEIEHARPAHMNGSDYVSDVLGQLRRFARIHDIHVWLLAHPTKPFDGNTGKPPRMWQISGSVNFWNKADYGLSIWRDPKDAKTAAQCQIEKVRFRETGRPGTVSFGYNPATRQLEEVS